MFKKKNLAEKIFACKNKTIVGHSLDTRYVIQPRGGKEKQDDGEVRRTFHLCGYSVPTYIIRILG